MTTFPYHFLFLNSFLPEYPCDADIPIWHLRLIPAIFGALLCPVIYQIFIKMGFNYWTATLAASLVIIGKKLEKEIKAGEGRALYEYQGCIRHHNYSWAPNYKSTMSVYCMTEIGTTEQADKTN